jgi:hypothetical protein
MALRPLVQAYTFCWDPELRSLAERTTDLFHDPQGELCMHQDRPRLVTTWKTETDIASLIEAEEVLGGARYREMATAVARFWWDRHVGRLPNGTALGYTNPLGLIGWYLHGQKADASLPTALDFHVRWATTGHDPRTGTLEYYVGRQSGDVVFVFRGIPYAQELLIKTGADSRSPASLVAWEDGKNQPATVLLYKREQQAVELTVRNPGEYRYGELRGCTRLQRRRQPRVLGPDLSRMWGGSEAAEHIRIPKDSPGGVFEVIPAAAGVHFVVADSRVPMMINAPSGFTPLQLRPPMRLYVAVPAGARNPRIYFGGSAVLFDPAGAPFRGGAALRGWVRLAGQAPGAWSFEPRERGLVKVAGLDPCFALGDKEHLFDPAS